MTIISPKSPSVLGSLGLTAQQALLGNVRRNLGYMPATYKPSKTTSPAVTCAAFLSANETMQQYANRVLGGSLAKLNGRTLEFGAKSGSGYPLQASATVGDLARKTVGNRNWGNVTANELFLVAFNKPWPGASTYVRTCGAVAQGSLGAPPAANPRASSAAYYVVKPGDTFSTICRNLRIAPSALIAANPGRKTMVINGQTVFRDMYVDDKIRLPVVPASPGRLSGAEDDAPGTLGAGTGESCENDGECDSGNCVFGFCAPSFGGGGDSGGGSSSGGGDTGGSTGESFPGGIVCGSFNEHLDFGVWPPQCVCDAGYVRDASGDCSVDQGPGGGGAGTGTDNIACTQSGGDYSGTQCTCPGNLVYDATKKQCVDAKGNPGSPHTANTGGGGSKPGGGGHSGGSGGSGGAVTPPKTEVTTGLMGSLSPGLKTALTVGAVVLGAGALGTAVYVGVKHQQKKSKKAALARSPPRSPASPPSPLRSSPHVRFPAGPVDVYAHRPVDSAGARRAAQGGPLARAVGPPPVDGRDRHRARRQQRLGADHRARARRLHDHRGAAALAPDHDRGGQRQLHHDHHQQVQQQLRHAHPAVRALVAGGPRRRRARLHPDRPRRRPGHGPGRVARVGRREDGHRPGDHRRPHRLPDRVRPAPRARADPERRGPPGPRRSAFVGHRTSDPARTAALGCGTLSAWPASARTLLRPRSSPRARRGGSTCRTRSPRPA